MFIAMNMVKTIYQNVGIQRITFSLNYNLNTHKAFTYMCELLNAMKTKRFVERILQTQCLATLTHIA